MSTLPYPRMSLQDADPLAMQMAAQQQPQMALTGIQHPMHAMVAPISAAPQQVPMQMSADAAPEAAQPARMSPIDQREAELEQGLAKKPQGFWGKLGHGLGMAGRIAGDIIAPAETELIVGGLGKEGIGPRANEFRNREMSNLEKQRSEQGLQSAQAGNLTANAGHTEAETPEIAPDAESRRQLEGAQTEHLNAETGEIGEPGPPEIHDTPMGLMAIDKKNATATPVTANGKPIGPKLETSVVQGIISHLDNKPHSYLVDKQGNKVADLGEHYERPISVNVGRGTEDKERGEVLKAYQPTLDSAERMNVMTESYEKAIKDHDQQAMLNLLANHLGMTMGLQKGARLTKDIINEAKQSQPWLAGIQSKFDKDGYLSGVTLSPNQMLQMVNLGQERYAEDAKKSRSTAQYLGAKDDGPERVPGRATINFYLGRVNGDAAKAKQLAAADGWSVK